MSEFPLIADDLLYRIFTAYPRRYKSLMRLLITCKKLYQFTLTSALWEKLLTELHVHDVTLYHDITKSQSKPLNNHTLYLLLCSNRKYKCFLNEMNGHSEIYCNQQKLVWDPTDPFFANNFRVLYEMACRGDSFKTIWAYLETEGYDPLFEKYLWLSLGRCHFVFPKREEPTDVNNEPYLIDLQRRKNMLRKSGSHWLVSHKIFTNHRYTVHAASQTDAVHQVTSFTHVSAKYYRAKRVTQLELEGFHPHTNTMKDLSKRQRSKSLNIKLGMSIQHT